MAPTTTPAPPSTGPPAPTPAAVRVSPLVLLAAADAYTRRPDGAGRVVGTLLGVASPDTGLVDVRDCFVVPHSEANDTVRGWGGGFWRRRVAPAAMRPGGVCLPIGFWRRRRRRPGRPRAWARRQRRNQTGLACARGLDMVVFHFLRPRKSWAWP